MSALIVPFPIYLPPGTRGRRRETGPVAVIATGSRALAGTRAFSDALAAHAARLGMPELIGIAAEAEALVEAAVQRLTEAQEPRRRR